MTVTEKIQNAIALIDELRRQAKERGQALPETPIRDAIVEREVAEATGKNPPANPKIP